MQTRVANKEPHGLRSPGRLRAAHQLLAPHLRYAALALGFLTLSRIGLTLWLHGRWELQSDAGRILLYGLRMDVIVLSYSLIPALALSLLAGGPGTLGRAVQWTVRAYLTLILTLFVLLEASTPLFVLEYDMRPNRLFIEYLVHPSEVSSMLLKGYAVGIAVVAGVTGLGAWFGWRQIQLNRPMEARVPVLDRVALFLVLAPAVFLGARSSLQHRPANPSSVAMWNDHLVNDLCLSSLYSVAYAAEQMKDEGDACEVYGKLESRDAIFSVVRAGMVTVDSQDFTSDVLPTLHNQRATNRAGTPKNLVIILEESLGAQYVPELGGESVTQFLGTLRDSSWWFENLYATGTRSVRGIEATVSGFLPTPARSVVKLGMSQTGFFTIAELLKREGYLTQFFYGGEAHFDNMRRFFTGNGFDEIIDEASIENPSFVGSWGACDEDVFRKAHETFETMGERPFFSVIFSVSNHSPFDYPEGKIELIEPEPASPLNAVRYADYALGKFIESAKASSYWDDTVFLIVADHDARVHGASLVPVEHFHIPGVILGAGIEPRRDGRLTSQIDLAPTLLSLIGVSGAHPMIGHDLTKLPDDAEGRAILQYGANQAYLTPTDAVIHQPHQEPKQFTWRMEAEHKVSLCPTELDPVLRRRALAHALLPSVLYRERLYALPAATPPTIPVAHGGHGTRVLAD